MSIQANPADPITNGDTSCSVIYHVMDAEGSLWRSAPTILVNGLRGDGIETASINASGEWLRIPTLRHLLPGTVAEIEIYIQRDNADRQLYRVLGNDPTVDYVDFLIQSNVDGTTEAVMRSVTSWLDSTGPGEDDYTIGDALPNDPPPQFSCLTIWRNRAIGCRGNTIYPSQEFAAGLGIQWSNGLKIQWTEGTGDIVAICPVDWNYCAIKKQDAIGIISGPGPDGVGHGNFIVQTLATKMGTTNPRSVVNGSDGCYFQDEATNRIAVITPQLNPAECLLGWFNTQNTDIVAAMQVEANRQVWFATGDGQMIVLDYKHKTAASPFGQVFTWTMPFRNTARGLAIVNGLPTAILSDGKLVTYLEAQAYDNDGTTTTPILQKFRTGALQPANLQGMFDVSRIQFLGEYLSQHGIKLTVYRQYEASAISTATATVTSAPEQFVHRPAGCMRVQSIELEVEELASLNTADPPVAILGKGLKFVGFALDIQPRGKLQGLDVGRII